MLIVYLYISILSGVKEGEEFGKKEGIPQVKRCLKGMNGGEKKSTLLGINESVSR